LKTTVLEKMQILQAELPPPISQEKIVMAAVPFNVPVITPDNLVAEEDEMKPVETLENVQIGNAHVEGIE